ncbi:MAG: arginine deiminase [Oscillospiraceae bacterium]
MCIKVKSEIGALKKVMLHRPGEELEHLIPNSLERLLFDDIPYLYGAQAEHDQFANVLRANGVDVVYLEDMAAEAIKQSAEIRNDFIDEVIANSGEFAVCYKNELKEYFSSIKDEKELVLKTMSGVSFNEIKLNSKNKLTSLLMDEYRFVMDPIPNLYFTRDPFATIGNGVSLNRMYSITRNRETIYGKYALTYNPEYAGKVPFYYTPNESFNIEGGDILNLTANVLAVGISQRTKPEAIEQLANNIFSDESSEITTILAFEIPQIRAFMHLDTVFTQVDFDKFTVHPGIIKTLRTFEITKGDVKGNVKVRELDTDLDVTLAKYIGVPKVTLIRCGGNNPIAAEREQWNDGSNTLSISPGVVVVYDRNYVTNKLLEENGVKILKISSGELSRGRGGPRCMSMPLVRENI